MTDLIALLKAANHDIERRDPVLHRELRGLRSDHGGTVASLVPGADAVLEAAGQPVDRSEFTMETIVLSTGRPVLAIERDEAALVFTDPDSAVWQQRLHAARAHLIAAARAVGRIEVVGHEYSWLGTGWLVRPDVIVTNRHVAAEFGMRSGTSFVFRQGLGGNPMTASVDFLEEFGRPDELTYRLERILHIEDPEGPDLAFLQVSSSGTQLPAPIRLSTGAAVDDQVAVIGYPARDSRIPDQPLMDLIFGEKYDKKRLAPGQLTGFDARTVRHDCSTLGGNSGSVVLSLDTGQAVGLHFAGRFLQGNFAVPSGVVAQRLAQVLDGTSRPQIDARPIAAPTAAAGPGRPGTAVSFVIPLRVTVEIGDARPDPDHQVIPGGQIGGAATAAVDAEQAVLTEAVASDYQDRTGYSEDFLGTGASVPLPSFAAGHDDVLAFEIDGRAEHVLRYEHFSLAMSRSRRLCHFSAVNIDGLTSVPMARVGWRTDPRIAPSAQISKECYGNPPKFARGHMTRRQDPVWGHRDVAKRGNADSMHVTNAVPQMQPFNGGIWLELEDYALENARQDDMRISVFTGPFLGTGDPIRFGVQIPVEFWKLIVFIHDRTRALCATGYTMSQETFLSEQEFVFGRHKTSQRSIASIEQRTGLSFGPLAAVDPFEELEFQAGELTSVQQIRFF